MKSTSIYLILLLISSTVFGQRFTTMINDDNIAYLRDFTVETNDGEILKGNKLSMYSATFGRIVSFAFKTEDGVKHKFKADEVKQVTAKLTKVAKIGTITDGATKSIESAVTTDYAGIVAENLVRFNSVVYNSKNGKKALLQLVNYGFDQKLKVYPDPNSEEGITSFNGTPVFGGGIKAFFIVKDGIAIKVDKKSYKKLYSTIYDNCPEMEIDPKSISIKNIAKDILRYNVCN